MTTLMVFPMHLSPSGRIVIADDADDDYMAGELAMLLGTWPGERVLVPDYGVDDPVFDPTPMPASEVAEKVEMFGPPVMIEDVTLENVSDMECDITVDWQPLDQEDDDPVMLTEELDY